jgi:hypothetical protein
MNPAIIKKQTTGSGPFVIRTSDGKEYHAPHGEFIGFTRHYVYVEDEKGGVDILDRLHVVSVRPVGKRRPRS